MGVSYSISALAAQSGLTTHTIRAWERRYNALSPQRSDTNRRLYSEEDVQRLGLLKSAINAGHSIGQIAQLKNEELAGLASERPSTFTSHDGLNENAVFEECVAALDTLDEARLRAILERAASMSGVWELLSKAIIPLMQHIDTMWQAGKLSVAQEHMASAVIKGLLNNLRAGLVSPPAAPKMLVTTPRGQNHEIGALIVSIVAALESWNPIYLGPNLPAQEIASAVQRSSASAVALSIVYPLNDPTLEPELAELRTLLGAEFPIFVGGRGIEAYHDSMIAINAIAEPDLDSFRRKLYELIKS